MSRRLRTLEILAAAQLAPQELARERERTARQSQTTNATLAALSSLIPAGANLAGTLADIDAAKSDRAAKAAEAATAATRQKDLDALNRQNVESQVAERAAQGERAAAEAERKSQTDLRANADKARERALDALRGRAAGGANEMDLRRVAMDDDALGDMDDDSVRGVMVAEQEKQAKAQAERAKVEADAEKARRLPPPKAPAGAKGPMSPEAKRILDARVRKAEAEAKIAEREANDDSPKPAKVDAVAEKKKAAVVEIDNYVGNIERNIDDVKKLIGEVGIVELTGPEGAVMDRKLTEIATDLAKLADPGSVAREAEVELQRRGLVPTGVKGAFTRDGTALQVLDALKKDVASRRAYAYRVRGLDAGTIPSASPAAAAVKKPQDMTPEEIDAELRALRGGR